MQLTGAQIVIECLKEQKVDTVFGYPGMGKLFIESMLSNDYSVVTTLVLLYGLLTLTGSLLSDIIMMIIDPRVRID